uniref:Biopolymer transport protein ExbB n=1 Tax=Candidatus Kentrum sp. FW TaxID=2126338 RepID=A0A450TWN7_9GAMM|nr:MAG: biopolymer transport protein ExbB [Candidatus Kentron sp. FW]
MTDTTTETLNDTAGNTQTPATIVTGAETNTPTPVGDKVSGDTTATDKTTGSGATGDGSSGDGAIDAQIPVDTITDPTSSLNLLEQAGSWLEIGGPVVVILLFMSFAALTIVVAKLLQFGWLKIGQRKPATVALAHWREGNAREALAILEKQRNPAAQTLLRAIRGRMSALSEARIREEVMRYGQDALFQLRLGLRPLEVIGTLAPLLGLLGTVLGMIKAFQQLEAAGNHVDPAILSGGIWEALLTTAMGLCVAIPVVALLNWLERRVDHLAHDMDNLVTQVFTDDLSAMASARTMVDPSLPSASAPPAHTHDVHT